LNKHLGSFDAVDLRGYRTFNGAFVHNYSQKKRNARQGRLMKNMLIIVKNRCEIERPDPPLDDLQVFSRQMRDVFTLPRGLVIDYCDFIIFHQLFYQVASDETEAACDDHVLLFNIGSPYSRS
jgi:hypothetical protein